MELGVNGSPQLEDGYTRIANELLEAIASAPMTLGQIRICLFLVRNTYGFGGKKT